MSYAIRCSCPKQYVVVFIAINISTPLFNLPPRRDTVLFMELNPYEKFLAGQEPIPVLTTTADRLYTLTAPLSGAQLERAPAPGKWNIREIVAHLGDCEIAYSFRLRQTLSQKHALIQPFDQQTWAERYAAYDLDSALALFKSARNWNLRLLTTVSEEDRHRPTTHPERGTISFWTLVETMAGHDLNHLQQIERLAAQEI